MCLTLCDPLDCSLQPALSIEFSRQGYWSGLPFPSPGDLPDPGIRFSNLRTTREAPQGDKLLPPTTATSSFPGSWPAEMLLSLLSFPLSPEELIVLSRALQVFLSGCSVLANVCVIMCKDGQKAVLQGRTMQNKTVLLSLATIILFSYGRLYFPKMVPTVPLILYSLLNRDLAISPSRDNIYLFFNIYSLLSMRGP